VCILVDACMRGGVNVSLKNSDLQRERERERWCQKYVSTVTLNHLWPFKLPKI